MKKILRSLPAALLAAVLLLDTTGCKSVYYAAYEKLGVDKRDLLKKRVIAARDDQQTAQKAFKDALTRLKEINGFQGGEAERAYRQLKSEYDDCASQAETVHRRIRAVESVAGDLFAEWDRENGEIKTASLRDASRRQLVETRQRYDELHAALVAAEDSMAPVLSEFNDYVLYLKHNLDAQAIASLQGESASIQTEIGRLIEQMNQSIARADSFVKQMQ